jgi:methionyl-tRNA synthetase
MFETSISGCVFSHGFVNAADGKKMSKSLNNTVDPLEVS